VFRALVALQQQASLQNLVISGDSAGLKNLLQLLALYQVFIKAVIIKYA